MQYWLNVGLGVNSVALAVLLVEGKLPQYAPFRFLFADTKTEKDHTYRYKTEVFDPYLEQHGYRLEVAYPAEGVLERWERFQMCGSRIFRACTDHGKAKPLDRYKAENGGGDTLIGIDAAESHRAKRDRVGFHYPLVDLDLDRDDCERIIAEAGLPSPGKSGCWCCPFMRVSEVINLAKTDPCKFERIAKLEEAASAHVGRQVHQWGDHQADYWRQRAAQGDFFVEERDPTEPCGCYDG